MSNSERRILLGRMVGAFGIRGQVKIESWTEPRDAIFRYQPWILVDAAGKEREFSGARGKESGKQHDVVIPVSDLKKMFIKK